jgi:hypothetical protein
MNEHSIATGETFQQYNERHIRLQGHSLLPTLAKVPTYVFQLALHKEAMTVSM